MSDTMEIHKLQRLRIWQQNLNCSLEGQCDLLQSLRAKDYNLAMLQELHIDFIGRTRSNLHWMVVYAKWHLADPSTTHSVILVNQNLTSNNWTKIPFPSPDMTGI